MTGKDIVTGARLLTQQEAKRFIPEGNIIATDSFWTMDGGYVFGGEYRAGIVYGTDMELGTTDVCASKIGVRPAVTLATGDVTQGIRPGDKLTFTSPDSKSREEFTFLGVSDDNKFIAICDRNLTECAFSPAHKYNSHEYGQSGVKAIIDNVAVNIQSWDCELTRQQELDINKPATYRDESRIVDELKKRIAGDAPCMREYKVDVVATVRNAICFLEPEIPDEIKADVRLTDAGCMPYGDVEQLTGITQCYSFADGNKSEQQFILSEDALFELTTFARQHIADNYLDIVRMDPEIIKKVDKYIRFPGDVDKQLRSEGLEGLADSLEEGLAATMERGRSGKYHSVNEDYIDSIRELYPIYAGYEHNIATQDDKTQDDEALLI